MTPPLVTDSVAIVLDPDDAADARVLESLFADETVTVLDSLDAQRRGLSELVPTPADDVLTERPRWIHYPWRRTVVHLLGPVGFRMVRLDRNRNKITAADQSRLASVSIGVVGLSVGHAVAHTLALEGLCGELRVADFDDLELSNLNRIPATVLDLGSDKTAIIARRIAELDPYLSVVTHPHGVTAATVDEFVRGLDVVVEECDSLDVKVLLREAARRHRVPVVMETSDRGLLDVERYDLEPERPLFHGALGTLDSADLSGLSTHDKVPHVMSILGATDVSAQFAASMVEVDRTISTWPQLGGDVALGGATVAAAVRRIALGRPLGSGRIRIDVESMLDELVEQAELATTTGSAPTGSATIESAAAEPAATEPRRSTGSADTAESTDPHSPWRSIADAARRAPSGGNVQPWIVAFGKRGLVITSDPSRTTTLDVAYRGTYVAVGAALFNSRVAAARAGMGTAVEIDDLGDGTVRATVTASGTAEPDLTRMFDAMTTRSTNRNIGTPAALGDSARGALLAAARAEGASVVVLSDRDTLDGIGAVLAESDRLRYLTEHLHREMMSELRWPGDDDPDTGIDVATLALDATDLVKLSVAARADVMALLAAWDAGTALGDDTRDRMTTTSAVAIVTAPGDSPLHHVRAGSAVERVWIEAEMHGLAVHPVSPVFLYARVADEFDELSSRYADRLVALRRRFLDLAGLASDPPIALVLRLSHCDVPAPVSRRRPH